MANATQSDERPPKRARTLSGSEDGAPVVRSTKYWLDDGNVILQVESTQFRLNKSTLSFYSPVFRDMFSLPLPPDEPLVENCPVVVLAGDRSEDWLYLLEVMFPPEYRPDKKPTITELAAVLRLSQKYDIANFRRGCLRRLNGEFPTSLTDFDAVYGEWSFIKPTNDNISVLSQVINLAREIGLLSILPLAFYILVERQAPDDVQTMVSGLHRLEDRIAALAGHVKMRRSYTETPLKWLKGSDPFIPCATCTQKHHCESARKEILLNVGTEVEVVGNLFIGWGDSWDTNFCKQCKACAKKVWKDTREECWKQLPSYFGLPTWEELRRMDQDPE